jgi:AGCS family alanine or glycine:cation symporter
MGTFFDWLSGLVWNQVFIFAFLVIGLVFSIATRFVQVTQIKDMIKFTFTGGSSENGISSFQALSMSLGSRVGTGNIAGVVTAISFGGPGAVFWMWVMAFVGAATSYVEVTLAQIYKSKLNGEYRGGTPFFMHKGLGFKKLAIVYAFITIIANGFLLMNIQSNTVAIAMEDAFGMSRAVTGIILVAFLALVVFGGVKRIAKTAEIAVPFMAIGYILLALILIFANFSAIPEVFRIIVSSAFGADATFGGIVGSAISWGIQRGYFSNAAGSGGETFEGAAAEVSHPAKQGLVQSFAVYIDTWIICSMTAFMVIITGMYNVEKAGVNNIPGVVAGGTNVQIAIDTVFSGWGKAFLAVALLFFCFTTMISYYYKSETSLSYLNAGKGRPWASYTMKFGIMIFVFLGTLISAKAAWAAGDVGLGSMAYLNLFALLFLSKYSVRALNDYKAQKKAGKDPTFDPIKLGIKNADFWEEKLKANEEINPSEIKVKNG